MVDGGGCGLGREGGERDNEMRGRGIGWSDSGFEGKRGGSNL